MEASRSVKYKFKVKNKGYTSTEEGTNHLSVITSLLVFTNHAFQNEKSLKQNR